MKPHRVRAVVALLVLTAVAVLARAVEITVLEHDRWRERARRQHERKLDVPSRRGDIRSADGHLLATTLDRVAIQVDTAQLDYPELFAAAASPLLGVSPKAVADRLGHRGRAIWLAKQVDEDTGRAVQALAPNAVVLVPDCERVYPLGRIAAPVLGFVGREELLMIGRVGLEQYYDTLLTGEPDRCLAIHDAVQRQVRLERLRQGRRGLDLELTLDARLQAASEAALARACTDLRADGGSAVMLDVASGAILALASFPSFDPARPGDAPPEHWRLRPVQDALEPGSTIKPLVAATALASGRLRRGERFDCSRRGIEVAGRWVRDHADPGVYTIDEIVIHSANAGIIMAAERLDRDTLWRGLTAFGLGERADIGFPAETRGSLPALDRWSRLTPSGLALGQELTTSPLQLALAYAAIANGGWLLRPQLVGFGADHPGSGAGGRASRRVLDRALAARLQGMLEAVVTEGTGSRAGVPGYRVAGKTGTAQRAVNGRFDDTHHIAWFAGFLPMPAPRVVVVVAIDTPREDFWGASAAAPVFASIAAAAASLLGLPAEPPAVENLQPPRTAGVAAPRSEERT